MNRPILFRQLFEHLSSTYTYILGCPIIKLAVIIDPVIETADRDSELIKELGLTLTYGLNTHVHADHRTSTGELKKHFPKMQSILSDKSGARADKYVAHGEKIKAGNVELEVRATPGHTNGCITYVNHVQGMAFTGDALLIRKCGRTDFQQGDAHRLYKSVHEQIFSLPDDYILYPGHDYTGQTCTSVAEEKKFNKRLAKSEEEFVQLMKNLNLPYPEQIGNMCQLVVLKVTQSFYILQIPHISTP